MKFVANCFSQPSRVRSSSGSAMMPALLTRMCRGWSQAARKRRTESWSARSRASTDTCVLPVERTMPAAIPAAACGRRTARAPSAPAEARARAVSMPMPELAPVTMARLPDRSTPSITSDAVEWRPNGLWKRWDMDLPPYAARADSGGHGHEVAQTHSAGGDRPAIGKQFASVVEQDDAVAQQAPALPGLICHDPCGQVIRCRPLRAPRLVLTHISLRL